jgi:hypothetical protein
MPAGQFFRFPDAGKAVAGSAKITVRGATRYLKIQVNHIVEKVRHVRREAR